MSSKVLLYDLHPTLEDLRAAVLAGLRQPQKAIAPRFLYDQTGAGLFEQITTLPEYYLTRTEIAILRDNAAEIAMLMGHGALIEFGSGNSQKVRILLDALRRLRGQPVQGDVGQGDVVQGHAVQGHDVYVAIDISKQQLYAACEQLSQDYEGLQAIALCADYNQRIDLETIPRLRGLHKTVFFPGSTIGNLELEEAIAFLGHVEEIVGVGGGLLIGVDLKKDAAILEPAYADSQGISAAFALNLLTRLNRELAASFDLNQFDYRAPYNPGAGRIEMQLVSQVEQVVQVAGEAIAFGAGEPLRTEHSYKYTVKEFEAIAQAAGFELKCQWQDAQGWFAVLYLVSAA